LHTFLYLPRPNGSPASLAATQTQPSQVHSAMALCSTPSAPLKNPLHPQLFTFLISNTQHLNASTPTV
jgi:hypothetical protein